LAAGSESFSRPPGSFGVSLGCELGLNRFTFDYGYFGLQAKQASPYQFNVHNLSLGYGREFVLGQSSTGPASNWGFEATAAAGLGLLSRAVGSARENGKAPSGIIGLGFFQRQGHSRLSLGLDNTVFTESRPAGSARTVSLAYLIAIRGGVTYVF
jgi:hypothetical protein